jgi:hypothetical protein
MSLLLLLLLLLLLILLLILLLLLLLLLLLRLHSAAFQGGFIPDCILYASYFYTKRELPIRLAFFWMINYLCETVGY